MRSSTTATDQFESLRSGAAYGNAFVEINEVKSGRQIALVRTKIPVPADSKASQMNFISIESGEDYLDLFVAAPDLFNALLNTLCRICDVYIGDPPKPDMNPCTECADARVAVAKVRGELVG